MNIIRSSLHTYLTGIAILLCFLVGSCGQQENINSDANTAKKQAYVLPDSIMKRISIADVTTGRAVKTIGLTGKVTPNDDHVVKVYPLVSGIAQSVKVVLGDYVNKGQELGTIRSSEMAGYSTDLITAQANLDVAKKNMEATADMFKSGLASSREYQAAQSAYKQAQAALTKAQKVLQLNGGGVDGLFIVKAPISGFVVEKFLTNNMAIRPDNTSNLFTISDLKNVWIMANVYESNIPYIKLGDSVTVTTISYPDKVFKGRVDKIMNVLDPTNKVMKVRIVLSNPDYLLKPEMFANVTIITKTSGKEMLTVPNTTLIFDNNQYYVLVYKSKSDITIRPVQIGGSVDDKTYIVAGLEQGEKVIASEALLIYQQLNS